MAEKNDQNSSDNDLRSFLKEIRDQGLILPQGHIQQEGWCSIPAQEPSKELNNQTQSTLNQKEKK